jgi:hypothetical protein
MDINNKLNLYQHKIKRVREWRWHNWFLYWFTVNEATPVHSAWVILPCTSRT